MNKPKVCKGCRASAREKRAAVRKAADGKRVAVRGKVRGAVAGVLACLALGSVAGCNTATPASKSASTKACDNVTTVNNYIGLLPYPATNGAAFPSGAVALGAGGLTISVSDLNGTIAQSADTEGGDRTDLTANPSMAAGITGDAPIKAITDAVAAFASPKGAADATLAALLERFGFGATTNAVSEAVASACAGKSCADCSDGSCTVK